MTKVDFLSKLRTSLERENIKNIETYVTYYSEIIEDYLEDGFSEKEAITKMGSIDEIVETILDESGQVNENLRKKNPFVLFLLIIGAPLWGSILLSILLFLFSGLIIVWCGPFILGCLSFAGFVTGAVSLMGLTFNTGVYYIVTQLGVGIFALGLGLFLLISTMYVAKHVSFLSKKFIEILSNLFSWRGRVF